MDDPAGALDRAAAETDFSGVVRVDVDGTVVLERAYGMADRAHRIPNTVDTRFGIASGTKGLTALTVVSLVEDGRLDPATTARSLLGDDLPMVDDGVTVEHLLAHRSGIGDYVDEESDLDVDGYVLTVPVHELATTEQYVRVLDGRPSKFPPGERFSYSNSGYVLLALLAERATGTPFADLVDERVCRPAGMAATAFLRSDELPGDAAVGYLTPDQPRTNVFHLPVRGSGDGGIYSSAADVHALWSAFLAGRIVSPGWVAEMVRPRSDVPSEGMRYGLGLWLHESRDTVRLEGWDAGVRFRSETDPARRSTWTMLSNTTVARAFSRLLDELVEQLVT
ncbi:MAG TPA: serine hydrolase domain-containing protein [Acidimicrobiales bacterium]|jgi:CubicO group peptidase (beta-lactamase class C family)